jgi:hypothetical protein
MDARFSFLLLTAVSLGSAAHAQGNSLFISANVMTGFTWNPATTAGTGVSGSCATSTTPTQYYLEPFWTDVTAGSYTLSLSYPSYQAGFVYIYRDAFRPQDPCDGLIVFGLAPVAHITGIALDANRQYVFVTSEATLFGGGGAFHATLDGPPGSHIQRGYMLPAFHSTTTSISLYAGGTQSWDLDAGPAHAGQLYLVLGSLSGTAPGIPLGGGLTLPLNHDFWLDFTLSMPNAPPLFESLGVLDAAGTRHAFGLDLPSGLPAALAGIIVHHAFVAIDGSGTPAFVSTPLPLYLTY